MVQTFLVASLDNKGLTGSWLFFSDCGNGDGEEDENVMSTI